MHHSRLSAVFIFEVGYLAAEYNSLSVIQLMSAEGAAEQAHEHIELNIRERDALEQEFQQVRPSSNIDSH